MTLAVDSSGIEAITNFTDLQNVVERSMERDYTDEVLDYIRLAEARFNRELRGPDMEKLETLTLSSGAAAKPEDFLEARRVTYNGETLTYVSSAELANLRSEKYAQVVHYSIIGGEIVVPPETSGDIQLLYWKTIPALGNNIPSNWLLTSHPDLYFATVMAEACADVKDDDSVYWQRKADALLVEVQGYLTGQSIGGPLTMRPITQPICSRI